MNPMRCPHCGATEGEPIEEEVPYPARRPFPGLKVVGEWDNPGLMQPVMLVREVVREVYFNSEEGPSGVTEFICSECRQKFTYKDVLECES